MLHLILWTAQMVLRGPNTAILHHFWSYLAAIRAPLFLRDLHFLALHASPRRFYWTFAAAQPWGDLGTFRSQGGRSWVNNTIKINLTSPHRAHHHQGL